MHCNRICNNQCLTFTGYHHSNTDTDFLLWRQGKCCIDFFRRNRYADLWTRSDPEGVLPTDRDRLVGVALHAHGIGYVF